MSIIAYDETNVIIIVFSLTEKIEQTYMSRWETGLQFSVYLKPVQYHKNMINNFFLPEGILKIMKEGFVFFCSHGQIFSFKKF